jgi:hypothetical protein
MIKYKSLGREPRQYRRPPLTRHQIGGAVATARHLLAHGLMPIFDTQTAQAIRHRDPELAARLVVVPHDE